MPAWSTTYMRKAGQKVETAEIVTNLGILIGAVFAGIFTYNRTTKPSSPTVTTDAVVAGVGVELGNRHQTEQLIAEVRRCADCLEILADRKREETEEKLDEILERLDERERRSR